MAVAAIFEGSEIMNEYAVFSVRGIVRRGTEKKPLIEYMRGLGERKRRGLILAVRRLPAERGWWRRVRVW